MRIVLAGKSGDKPVVVKRELIGERTIIRRVGVRRMGRFVNHASLLHPR
jgi:hypothetical protein